MKGIILDPLNAENYSSITGRQITGNLGVQQSDIGTGGEADFTLDGSATGNITIPTVPAAVDGDATTRPNRVRPCHTGAARGQ